MATITKPMALDESFNTTESTSRNQADVLVGIEQAIMRGFGQVANAVSYDNTDSGLTADNVQDAIDEVDDTVDGLVDDVTEISSDIESTQTVSGNSLTLTDCAPINAESLVVELEPKQDLHGQDAPYVGGAGKNKIDTSADSDFYIGHYYVGVNGSMSEDNNFDAFRCEINGDTTYTLSNNLGTDLSGSGGIIRFENADKSLNSVNTSGFSHTSATFELPTNAVYIVVCVNNTLGVMLQLEEGSTATTFAPYSNICPITGYTECEVDDVGKNLLNIDAVSYPYTDSNSNVQVSKNTDGSIKLNGTATGEFLYPEYPPNQDFYKDLKPSTNYIASIGITTSDITIQVYYRETSASQWTLLGEAQGSLQFTTPSVYYDIWVRYMAANGTSFSNLTIYPMVRLATDADSNFEPYHSSNATIQFGQTVYGGRSNFTEGGTSDKWNKYDTYSGWYKASTETTVIINSIVGKKSGTNQIYCNTYKYVANQGFGVPLGAISDSTNSTYLNYIFINDSRFAGKTVQECQAILESDGMYFVYQVETPTQLSTPPTELKMFKGVNNITTNGTTINLGYQPDNVIGEVKGEIEKCAVDAEFMQFTDGTDTFTDVNLSLDAFFHTVSVVGSKIEQKRFMCFEVMDKMGGVLQGILASGIAFTDGAKTPSGTAFRAYIESLQMYVNFRIYGSGGSYTLAYQSESSFSASAFYVRVRLMNNL